MKIPKTPPTFADITSKLDSDRLFKLLRDTQPVDSDGRYLHWDKLRFLPPPAGLTSEEYWLTTHFARSNHFKKTPFTDKTGATFVYMEPDSLRQALHMIDCEAKGTLTSAAQGVGVQAGKKHFVKSLLEEPLQSSLFEGAATTRDQAKRLVYENITPRTIGERMVLNNYRAMEFIKTILHEPLTPAIIMEVQNIVTEGTLENPKKAGVYREDDDAISVGNDFTGETYHTPPAASELTERIQTLCDFANHTTDQPGQFIHPLIRAFILHFMLAYDHPFVDGNGRTARALFYWYALKEGYWLLEYSSISKIITEAPVKYGMSFLYTETDNCDLTYFLLHQADTALKAIEALKSYLKSKQKELYAIKEKLSQQKGNHQFNFRQVEVLNSAAKIPASHFTIKEHEKLYQVSYITARKDLEDLTKVGLMKKKKSGKTYLYIPVTDFIKALQNI
jgi:Fic family protein